MLSTMYIRHFLIIACCTLLASACGETDDAADPLAPLVGTWTVAGSPGAPTITIAADGTMQWDEEVLTISFSADGLLERTGGMSIHTCTTPSETVVIEGTTRVANTYCVSGDRLALAALKHDRTSSEQTYRGIKLVDVDVEGAWLRSESWFDVLTLRTDVSWSLAREITDVTLCNSDDIDSRSDVFGGSYSVREDDGVDLVSSSPNFAAFSSLDRVGDCLGGLVFERM